MKKKLLSRLRDQFENKAYDAQGDYWWNVVHLIVFACCVAIALLIFLFG
jgi:hypothetical protein